MKPTLRPMMFCAVMLVGLCSAVVGQNKYWREIKGKPLVKFDWNCTEPATLPKPALNGLIEAALKEEQYTGTYYYADRAFAYDLNGDRQPEYFVPLVCGATGNCTFGLFSLNPNKFLGRINGEYLYLHRGRQTWPRLVTYGHTTAVEGTLVTFTFRRGRYQQLPRYSRTDSRGGIYGKKAPAFLDRARKGCANVAY